MAETKPLRVPRQSMYPGTGRAGYIGDVEVYDPNSGPNEPPPDGATEAPAEEVVDEPVAAEPVTDEAAGDTTETSAPEPVEPAVDDAPVADEPAADVAAEPEGDASGA
jgi:hypothetical protein